MAESFDPLRNTASRAAEDLHAQVQKNKSNTDDTVSCPSNDTVLMSQGSSDVNNQTISPEEQQSRTTLNKKVTFIDNAAEASIPSTNPCDKKVRKSSPPSNVINQALQGSKSEQNPVHIIEQQTKPYWETGQGSSEEWDQGQSVEYYDEDYETGQANDEYNNYQAPRKKKGISAKIDRLVNRFPALGVFYKTPPSSPDTDKSEQRYQYNETPDLTHADQSAHELTPDDLALNERYSNKLHIHLINLPVKEETQPVDLRIHHETNRIYLCDVGRSIVEIFDINGKLQHTIDGPSITKFKPTAISVAFDGSIIVASYFSHCLHMYSPADSQNGSSIDVKDSYQYKQYRLGVPGDLIHQFHFPAGIAVDNSDGYLYICDRGNYRIQVMRPEGICERLIELVVRDKKKYQLDPVRLAHQQSFEQIVCIVGTGDAICFFSKHANGRTFVEPLYVLDENGLGLEGASGIAVDAHDRIFIADTGHHRIVICTPQGDYITSVGMEGTEPGQLKRPCGLDITTDGTIVVTDAGNKRIQLFGSLHAQILDENNPPKEETSNDSNNLPTEAVGDQADFL